MLILQQWLGSGANKPLWQNPEKAPSSESSSVDSMGKRHVPQSANATRTVAFWHSLERWEKFLPHFHWNFNLREDKNLSKTGNKNMPEKDKQGKWRDYIPAFQ